MCGIAGIVAKKNEGKEWMKYLHAATNALKLRGPDAQNYFSENQVAFGHCRLSIIDLSEAANQPMTDEQKHYTIIYNGEIFNFKLLKKDLEQRGISFNTNSDTEILLKLYDLYGKEMLQMLNGFFALAIYDHQQKNVFIARDRFGVKPMFYYEDENVFVFASEMKALLQFPIKKEMDTTSLFQYLQLNYIPAPHTIFKSIKKILPGNSIFISNEKIITEQWYQIPYSSETISTCSYDQAQKKLFDLLNDAVQLRLISDVPLGSFLSGGIDSSIISGLASLHTNQLKTFSIGYSDDPFFDETDYAKLVAKHFKTEHTIFNLSRSDMYESLDAVLNYLDEPFADSSALPVYILSKQTRKHVKVALSGDGADEIFGGYLKHLGEFRSRNPKIGERAISFFSPAINLFPASRKSFIGNTARRIQKFAEGLKLNDRDRYWRWCSITNSDDANQMLIHSADENEFLKRRAELTKYIHSKNDFNEVLLNDVHLVLPNDMLHKVDSMSMANSLEVRTPFLDYRVVEFAFSIPAAFKIDRTYRKKIVHDAFKNFLPKELYHRRKKGFEIPLQSLLTHELRSLVDENLSNGFLKQQNIFNAVSVQKLIEQMRSNNPGDTAARVWALLVFQHWWKKWMN
ncbi:MAG: asparagine synthase (glutamine-hydrolyzing) [Chitinophagales bacterium]|nr:asparagine synthase (glutamine-hydrolyzing) [Chitinophagales bacterium]